MSQNNASPSKVLLLGISYPDVKGHMDQHGYSEKLLVHKKLSVDQAVELVRRGILTEMDARDLARCVATEQLKSNGMEMEAYSVSKEVGGVYRNDRHVYANFNNSRGLYNALMNNFGPMQFKQVILDYYWMPTGWLVTRWAKSLFQNTLPDLVRFNLLTFPNRNQPQRQQEGVHGSADEEKKDDTMDTSEGTMGIELEEGVVFLPFCAHVCKELVGAIHILKKYYAITFVHKRELPGHALWKGTMQIAADVMQHRLGKRLDQEEIYCTFQPKDIYGSMEDSHINKDDVMRMLLSIENFKEIRMIRLRPLRQHAPSQLRADEKPKPETGGFIGLNWNMGKRLFKEFRSRKKAPPPRTILRKIRTVTTAEDDSDTEISSSDDDSSTDDDEREIGEEIYFDTDRYIDVDYDPCDIERVEETTNYYPGPTLDLVTYIGGKEVIADDNVMDSWAETWGPKASRKKNRKQEFLQFQYQQMRKEHREFLSRHSRLPDPDAEESEGCRWKLSENDGWAMELKGDAPGAEHMRKIVQIAKRDTTMGASRHLFEMKNPGFKTFSRSYGYGSCMNCYQIPKVAVLSKIKAYKEAQAILDRRSEKEEESPDVSAKFLATTDDESHGICQGGITPFRKMTVEKVQELDFDSLGAHLTAYGQSTIPNRRKSRQRLLFKLLEEEGAKAKKLLSILAAGVNLRDIGNHVSPLEELATAASQRNRLTPVESTVLEINEFRVEEKLPPYQPAHNHLKFDLSGSDLFPRELYRLVQSAEDLLINHIISWQKKGKSIIVHDKDNFVFRVLSQCSSQAVPSYEKFVEILLEFGFREIQEGSRKGGYCHEYFRRRRAEDVSLICRAFSDSSDENDVLVSSSQLSNSEDIKISDKRRKSLPDTPATKRQAVSSPADIRICPKKSKVKLFNLSKHKGFPKELYRLLEEAGVHGFSSAIYWYPNGKSFAIADDVLFVKQVLSKRTKIRKISSLEANLIRFGFKKTRRGGNVRIYEHPMFVKGRPEKLARIKSGSISNFEKAIKTKQKQTSRNKLSKQQISERPQLKDSGNSETPPQQSDRDFMKSLRSLLDSHDTGGPISWLSDGSAFNVAKPEELESKIVTKYFTPMPYSAFRRKLMAMGFEPAGLRGEYRAIMHHGLFHRDFPEIWDLHDNKDLYEKVLYSLSLEIELSVDSKSSGSPTKATGDRIELKDFPFLKETLHEFIRSSFRVLIAPKATKSQFKLYDEIVAVIRELIGSREFSLLEKFDRQEMLKSLRAFFRDHFQKTRRELQQLKTASDSSEQKSKLQALIRQAKSVNFENLGLIKTSSEWRRKIKEVPRNCADAKSESKKDSEGSLGDLQDTQSTPAYALHYPARDADGAEIFVQGPAEIQSNQLELPIDASNVLNAVIPDTLSKDMMLDAVGKKRKTCSAAFQSRKKFCGNNAQKRGNLCFERSRLALVCPESQCVAVLSPESCEGITGRSVDLTSKSRNVVLTDGSLSTSDASHAVANAQQARPLWTATTLQSQADREDVGQICSLSRSAVLMIIRFPLSPLTRYLQSNNIQWFGGTSIYEDFELDIISRFMKTIGNKSLLESILNRRFRLECYITLLRLSDGPDWFRGFVNMSLNEQMLYVHSRLMSCFMASKFQSYMLQTEAMDCGEKLRWRSVYHQNVQLLRGFSALRSSVNYKV